MDTRPVDRIRNVNAASKDIYTYYPVVIIGGGESGICVGAQLQRRLKFDQFRIFERRSQLGGTWYTNRYPGIACDVMALQYSFSFAQNPNWTTLLPPGPEILRYMHDVCAKFKMLDKIQCDTNVKSMRWIEEDEEWELILEHLAAGIGDLPSNERREIEKSKGVEAAVVRLEKIRAKVVFSAAGGLVEPKPSIDVPGLESFKGKVIHTARWPDHDEIDLKDKHVVVVGTGCSAAQVIPPLLSPKYGPVKHITQLLRSPPWAVPFVPEEFKQNFSKWVPRLSRVIPGFQNALRKSFFTLAETEWYRLFDTTDAAKERRKVAAEHVLSHMHRTVPEKYHEILTPDYELFCKRRIVDDGWLKSFQDDRVDITSLPLTSLGENTATLGPGRHYPPLSKTDSKAPTDERTIPCDIVILANGYQTNEWLHPLDVTGRNNTSLSQLWKQMGGARAYMGTAMPSFPNFFMIFGPNTATGHTSVILASENQTNYALNFVQPILAGEASTVEIKPEAEKHWTDTLQAELRESLYAKGGCLNWYVDRETGWNSTTYPRSQVDFTIRCMFPRYKDWMYKRTTRGVVKLWLRRTVRTVLFVGLIAGLDFWRRVGTLGIKARAGALVEVLKQRIIQLVLKQFE